MEEFLQNICLLKNLDMENFSQNIEIEGQEILDEIKKKINKLFLFLVILVILN